MFNSIRHRLLISYLIGLAAILTIFALSIRLFFIHALDKQTNEKLTALAQGATSSWEIENIQSDCAYRDLPLQQLLTKDRGLEFFDRDGKLLERYGNYWLKLPFIGEDRIQQQSGAVAIRGVTISIEDEKDRLIGYVRASQSLAEYDAAISHLDWGLSCGITIALILSGIGGLLLTKQAMQPIDRSFARLQQFTADASHELRSPLMAIQTNAQVALRHAEGIRTGDRQKFQAIDETCKQLSRLTEDLLFLARNDDQPTISLREFNLNKLLLELIQIYRLQSKEKEINLTANLDSDLWIYSDRHLLNKLFTNLIVNAIKYTERGGKIQVNSSQIRQNAIVTIQDTGIGMSPEQVSKAFDRFWCANPSRNAKSGVGLGLAICQSIANLHHGKIEIDSQLGVGTCLTVILPLNINQRKSSYLIDSDF